MGDDGVDDDDYDWYAVLEREFRGADDSFMVQLRCDLRWDAAAFARLTAAMLACCRAYDTGEARAAQPTFFGAPRDTERVPRWLAEGFWYAAWFVRSWTTHPAWDLRKAHDPAYYTRAYERLSDLALWFFSGQCPSLDPAKAFAPL